MKRSKPLRRTRLVRTQSELKRSALPARRSRLPARSAKREAIIAERREFVERILRQRQWCEAHAVLLDLALIAGPLRAPSVDVHEFVRRSQGSPIVPSQGLADDAVAAVCRDCHRWIGEHPAEAVSLGLARWGMRASEQ